ncbi:hypothetical protein MKW92_008208 [Papaver armeniacum]|nr:hypothetical protein MKW92_008208 [Papaver armeniacum]
MEKRTGAPKQKWTAAAEEEALVAGINKHGTGKWKNIQNDPEFSHVLAARSNIDMKDKLMEECVSATGEGSRPKSVEAAASTPKGPKMTASSIFQSPPSSSQTTTEDAKDKVLVQNPEFNVFGDSGEKGSPNDKEDEAEENNDDPISKKRKRYDAMILEALSNITDPNGAEIGSINDFIEQRHEVPSNFRRLLSSKLRRLVTPDKLEKLEESNETVVSVNWKEVALFTFGFNVLSEDEDRLVYAETSWNWDLLGFIYFENLDQPHILVV